MSCELIASVGVIGADGKRTIVLWASFLSACCKVRLKYLTRFHLFTFNVCVITARAYARAVLGVVILSVRLSVTGVDCDKTKWCTAHIFIPHERAITLLLWHQQWLVGDAPFPLKSALKVTHPFEKRRIWQIATSSHWTLFLPTFTTLLIPVHSENDSGVYFLIVLTTDYCWRSWTCHIVAHYKYSVDWLIDWLNVFCVIPTGCKQ